MHIPTQYRFSLSPMKSYFAVVFALFVTLWQFPAHSYQRSKTPEGFELFWSTYPIAFTINSKGTPDLPTAPTFEAIRTSFKTWTEPSCTCLTFQDLGLSNSTELGYDQAKAQENINLIIFQTQSWTHSSQAVAVTSTIFKKKDGQIVAYDMELNNVDFKFSLDGQRKNGVSTMDVQNTVTHEVGHAIGLDHSSVNSAAMFAAGRPGETGKRTLHADDISGLCTIHPIQGGCINKNPQSLTNGGCAGCQSTTTPPITPVLFLALFFLFLRIRSSRSRI